MITTGRLITLTGYPLSYQPFQEAPKILWAPRLCLPPIWSSHYKPIPILFYMWPPTFFYNIVSCCIWKLSPHISPLNCLKDFRKNCVHSSISLLLCSSTFFLWKPVWLQKMPFNGTCCARTSWSFIQTPWWWKNPSLSFPWLIKGFWYPESCHINGQFKVLWSEWNFLKLVSFILAW